MASLPENRKISIASTSKQEEATSSCFSSSRRIHDVFISFRGKDTRGKFTGHLYSALKQRGIHAYLDDRELERGSSIEPSLWKAIEESRFSIIVFSKNFASSSWCLDELVKIVQCKEEKGHIPLPVFYDVDPSEVAKQTENYGKAFVKHYFRRNPEKVRRWKDSLTKIANLSGWDVRNSDESEIIRLIVEDISRKISCTISRTSKGLVGIEPRMKQLNGFLDEASNDTHFIGICGMGGLGKTTLAREVYERIHSKFEGACFLANVREVFVKHGAIPLQEQLLSETLMQEIRLRDDYKGIAEIQNRLRYKKVLVIVDDVNKREQLEKLAAEHRWFGPGSRIIITSRDKHILTAHGVTRIYEAEKLNDDEALIFFSSKAFKRDQPVEIYWEPSRRVVRYAHGLPLALEVIGSFLHGRSMDEWDTAINRMKENLDRDILDVLQISFDGLNELEKNIFLDIACFFKGMKEDRVTRILDHCGFHASIGIQVLIEKSLICVSQNELWMHDLLQIMGKEIVRRESPKNPGGRSRLWGYKDVFHALMNTTGRLECIYLDLPKTEQVDWNMRGFSKLSELRLLKICNVQLFQGPEYLSNELRFLEWHAFPSKSLPVSFQPDELVELDLSYSSIEQLWHGSKSLVNLKIINLSHSLNLTDTLDFTGTPNLERLILEGCKSLFDVHPSISFHKKLEYVNFVDCESLRSLPSNLEMESLKICALNGCSRLEKFPDIIRNMNGLEKLCLDATAIKELPSSIQYLSGLVALSMNDCKSLERLPSRISGLKSLQKLDLSCCSRLQNLPEDLGDVEFLKELDASGTTIRNVPVSIFLLKNLKVLSFDGCKGIDLALASLSCLCSLTELNLSDCNMREGVLPENLGCCLSTLKSLDLSRNSFVTLPNSINNLSRLETLALEDCMMLQSLPKLPSNIQMVNLNGCSLLAEILDLINLQHLKLLELKCLNCWKLYECNGGEEMVMDMLDKYLQGIRIGLRRPGFSIVVPGTTIPGKFWYKREASLIDVELPPKVKGIVACVAFVPCEFSSSLDNCGGGYLSCHMKTNGREDYPSSILINWNFIQVLSDHLWLFYLSFEDVEGWQYGSHNNIELSFCACERIKVTNCAVILICGMEQDELSLSALAPSMACTPLRQLEKGKSDWQIRIRVLHMWEGVSSLTHELRSLNLIVIDEEHTLCQCTIDGNLAWRFRPWLREGSFYVIRNLRVGNDKYNRPVSGDRKLTFLPITYIFDVHDNDSLTKQARNDDTLTGLDSRYGSRDGTSLSSCSSNFSFFSEPQTPRSKGEILQSPNLKTFTFSKLKTPRSEGEILKSPNLKAFTFRELKKATRKFRPVFVLGEGDFGLVFKGWVDEHSLTASRPGTGIMIAVKRLNQEGFQGHREWLAEINYLGQFQHPNLVKLIGYCIEDDHRLLVYEFILRGSMENHLFRRGSCLSWDIRMKVALGAARGLAFLHSAEANVIYRGFKTSNILLDSNYNAKLSDFGLARDGPTGNESHVSTRVMGTYGYAAPEYVATGHLTTKSDVYSFGVVLLEMLSGQRVVDINRPSGQRNLVEWAKPYLTNKHRVLRVLDARLEGQYVLGRVQKVASLALQCLAVEPKFRPSMDEVVTELEQLQEVKDARKTTHKEPVARPNKNVSSRDGNSVRSSGYSGQPAFPRVGFYPFG